MKKYLKSLGARALSPILCTFAGVCLAFHVCLVVFYAGMGGSDKLYQNVFKEIADGYAGYAIDVVDEGDLSALEEYFSKRGISCTITRKSITDPMTGTMVESQVFTCGDVTENPGYVREIMPGAYSQYNTDSLVAVLFGYNYISSIGDVVSADVQRIVYDKDAGYFYYETQNDYFKVEDIVVYQSGTYTDYILTKVDGQECYYNGYYKIKLDTTQYLTWDYVAVDGQNMPLVEDERFINTILVVSTSDIAEKGIGGLVANADLDQVVYYPEEDADIYIVQMNWNQEAATEMSLFTEWEYLHIDIMQQEAFTIVNIVISFVLFILGFVLLVYSANNEKEKLGVLHKAPVAIYSGIIFFAEFGILALFFEGIPAILIDYGVGSVELGIVLAVIVASVGAWLGFVYLQNIITRIKCKSFWRTTEVYYAYKLVKASWSFLSKPFRFIWSKFKEFVKAVLRPFKSFGKMVGENTPLLVGAMAIAIVFMIIELVVVYCSIWFWGYGDAIAAFLWIKVMEGAVLFVVLFQMNEMLEGSKRVASGDMSKPIDTSRMFWKFKEHGDNINKVSDGIALAVNERMKSEHFKTELITNVSHDIKTPLTSIINYVDLIKKEEIQDEKVQEYVDVLDRQSARLKKLIEDLMEASKASTGNLTVNLEECDLDVLLAQMIGEFEEKLQKNQLEVVVDKPDHPVKIMADGRHIWRVLDNLLNNTCKYSLPGTRVYVSLKQGADDVVITFKNISKDALNIPSDELMERFVRGDSSRNTEGSGLGLSIAQSLTELMSGSMKLDIDGDLFKVTLRFPATILK